MHTSVKPLKGFGGASVLEIVDDHQSDTYRAVYTVKFKNAIYVLHAFQKKSKKGIKTPQQEIELIRQRLKVAEEDHKSRTRFIMSNKENTSIRRGSNNVFADLGYADPDTHLLKAQLVNRIDEIISEQKLTQIEAAKIMGLSQPDVSRLLKGQFREISVERIMRLLMRLAAKLILL